MGTQPRWRNHALGTFRVSLGDELRKNYKANHFKFVLFNKPLLGNIVEIIG